MTTDLRPCSACGRHARTDETRCPHCGAELGLLHRLPRIDSPLESDYRGAPKYGGPPFVRAVRTLPIWIALAIAAWVVWAFLSHR